MAPERFLLAEHCRQYHSYIKQSNLKSYYSPNSQTKNVTLSNQQNTLDLAFPKLFLHHAKVVVEYLH